VRNFIPGGTDLNSEILSTRAPIPHPSLLLCSLLAMCLTFGLLGTVHSEDSQPSSPGTPPIEWTGGPGVGDLGSVAQIDIPEGYKFAGKDGAKKVLELAHNPVSEGALGVIVPSQSTDEDFFYITFTFQKVGYVRDDEKTALNPDAILTWMRKGAEAQNKLRQQKRWKPVQLLGWYKQPHYDSRTHSLTWAIATKSEDDPGPVVNYFARLLGRQGTVSVDLVVGENSAPYAVSEFDRLIAGFSYKAGEQYAQFRAGDKVAPYGLTALVIGGVGISGAKFGLPAKLWIPTVIGAVALIAIIGFLVPVKRIFRREENIESAIEPR
jgi:uncharacterized membrane-anchored protein